MGKNKRSKIIYNGLELDSTEELQFVYWLDEAKDAGLISTYVYQPCIYKLFENVIGKNVNNKEIIIIKEHIYTPDFSILFTKKFYDLYGPNKWNKIFKNLDDIKKVVMLLDIWETVLTMPRHFMLLMLGFL